MRQVYLQLEYKENSITVLGESIELLCHLMEDRLIVLGALRRAFWFSRDGWISAVREAGP